MNQSDFSPVKYTKMTVWISVLWKIDIQLAKKWAEMVVKWAIVIVIRFYSDYMYYVGSENMAYFLYPIYNDIATETERTKNNH